MDVVKVGGRIGDLLEKINVIENPEYFLNTFMEKGFKGEFECLNKLENWQVSSIAFNGYEVELTREEKISIVCKVYRDKEDKHDFEKGFLSGVKYIAREFEIKIPGINSKEW